MAKRPLFIGAAALEEALNGHEQRTPIKHDRGPYSAGLVDGFVLGVRAARAAAAGSDQ